MQKDGLGVVCSHNLIYLSFCYNVDEIYCVPQYFYSTSIVATRII